MGDLHIPHQCTCAEPRARLGKGASACYLQFLSLREVSLLEAPFGAPPPSEQAPESPLSLPELEHSGVRYFMLFARLPASPADLSPWNHWRMPVLIKELGSDVGQGPVLVTVEYIVIREKE